MRVLRLLSYQLQEMLTALIHNSGSLAQVHSSGSSMSTASGCNIISTAMVAVYPCIASGCGMISTAVDKIPRWWFWVDHSSGSSIFIAIGCSIYPQQVDTTVIHSSGCNICTLVNEAKQQWWPQHKYPQFWEQHHLCCLHTQHYWLAVGAAKVGVIPGAQWFDFMKNLGHVH